MHNNIYVEGAGASAIAVALRYLEDNPGRRVAAVISGGNIDREIFQAAISKYMAAEARVR
jgi:threonine dehydratase